MDTATEKIRLFLESRITWGVVTLVLAAIAYSGRVTVTISYILLFIAFLIGSFQIFRSDLRGRNRIFFCIALAVGILLITWWIRPKATKITRPYFTTSTPETIKVTPELKPKLQYESDYVTQITIKNVGDHGACNLYNRQITVDQNFKIQPNIVDGSKGNEISAGDSSAYSIGLSFKPTILPTYFIFAIKYQDKDVSTPKIFSQVWYYKQRGGTSEAPPLGFSDTLIPERENIREHLKEELKDYQE
jgi:hypothetical protein